MTKEAFGAGVCPICGKPHEPAYRPFCSKRCADIDLSRWLKGVYAIPGAAREEEEGPGDGSTDDDRPD